MNIMHPLVSDRPNRTIVQPYTHPSVQLHHPRLSQSQAVGLRIPQQRASLVLLSSWACLQPHYQDLGRTLMQQDILLREAVEH